MSPSILKGSGRKLILLVALWLVLSWLGGCGTPTVMVVYRETIQFQSYQPAPLDGNPAGLLPFASFYTITCINNTFQNSTGFTLDVSKVSYVDANGNKWPVVTAQIPYEGGLGTIGWFNTFLSAAQMTIAPNAAYSPPQPYSFVVAMDESQLATGQGKFHRLQYDAPPGVNVTMVQEGAPPPGFPPPTFKDIVGTADFKAGQVATDPPLPPPTCP